MPSSSSARTNTNAEVHASPSGFADIEKLYAWMQQSIMDGEEAQSLDEALAREIRPNSRQSAHRRMEIYSSDYFGRFQSVLAVDYAALEYAMGNAAWCSLSDAFVRARPSRMAAINAYGFELPDFFATYQSPHHAFLHDLARLQMEVARRQLMKTATGLEASAMAELTPDAWGNTGLKPRPSVDSYAFGYDVNEFLDQFNHGQEPMIPEDEAPTFVQVYRKGNDVWRQEVPYPRHVLFQALKEGATLADGLEQAANVYQGEESEFMGAIQSWFADWMQDGIFVEVVR